VYCLGLFDKKTGLGRELNICLNKESDRQYNGQFEVLFTLHRMSCPVHYKNFICVNNSRSTKVVFKEGKTYKFKRLSHIILDDTINVSFLINFHSGGQILR
jgi:hypothetical protein